MEAPSIQYVKTSDGVNIAFSVMGDGPPVVFASAATASIADATGGRLPQMILDGIVNLRHQVVIYDRRGAGHSDRNVADYSLGARAIDMEAVVARLNLDHLVVAAWAQATPTAIEFVHRNGSKVSRLILFEPWITGALRDQAPAPQRVYQSLVDLMKGAGETDSEAYFRAMGAAGAASVSGSGSPSTDNSELLSRTLTAEGLVAFNEASKLIDLTRLLPTITAQTLVIQSDEFPFRAQTSREVAALMPAAKLIDLSGRGVDAIVAAIGTFLAEGVPGGKGASSALRPDGLSTREIEVLRLIVQGKTNPQIADELVISRSTVQNHVSSILNKAGLANRAEAVAYAMRHGLS